MWLYTSDEVMATHYLSTVTLYTVVALDLCRLHYPFLLGFELLQLHSLRILVFFLYSFTNHQFFLFFICKVHCVCSIRHSWFDYGLYILISVSFCSFILQEEYIVTMFSISLLYSVFSFCFVSYPLDLHWHNIFFVSISHDLSQIISVTLHS